MKQKPTPPPNVIALQPGRPLPDGYHHCTIAGCMKGWRRGGLAGDAPLCPAHYHRARRDSPHAQVGSSIERREAFTVRPLPPIAELIRKEQKRGRGSISDAVNALLAELLVRRGDERRFNGTRSK